MSKCNTDILEFSNSVVIPKLPIISCSNSNRYLWLCWHLEILYWSFLWGWWSKPKLVFIFAVFELLTNLDCKKYCINKDTSKYSESDVTQSCPTLCDPMDYSLLCSSIHGIFLARILEWVAISFSRGSSRPRGWTWVSLIVGRHVIIWATREVYQILWMLKRNGRISIDPKAI